MAGLSTDLAANLLIIGASFIGLNWTSNITLTSSLRVSKISRLGKTAVGFSMIAFSTSLPELTVAIVATLSGDTPLSVGNVLGSNIVNIALIIGLAALVIYVRPSKVFRWRERAIGVIPSFAREELNSIHFGLLVSSIVPLILIYVAQATWAIGLILIAIFIAYMYQLSKIRMPEEDGEVTQEERNKLKRYVLLTFLGALGVVISANFLVESATTIAGSVGIPQSVIGATIIAVGTSLPELTLDLKSFLKGHPALAIGDIIGSSFVNITLILGMTLFLPAMMGRTVAMNMSVYQNLVIFSIITNLFFWYFLSQGRLTWKEGVLFLFVYVLFLVTTVGAL